MDMMMLLTQGLGMVSTLVYALMWTVPLIYVVLRWRAYRDGGTGDPQLGLKVVLHFFQSAGLFAALVGSGCVLYALMPPASGETVLRVGFPLLISGGVVFLVHVVIIGRRTNNATMPMVSKTFAGIGLVVTGVVGFLSGIALLISAFQTGETGESIRISLAAALVAVPAWATHCLLFLRRYPPALTVDPDVAPKA